MERRMVSVKIRKCLLMGYEGEIDLSRIGRMHGAHQQQQEMESHRLTVAFFFMQFLNDKALLSEPRFHYAFS